MAESDDAKGAAAGADAVAADGAKKKGGGLLFILLPVALVAAGGGGFLAYAKYPTIAQMMYTFNEAGSEEEEASEEEGEEGETSPYGTFLELKDIIVNPADSNGRRLLMVSLGLETTDPLLLESITAREMVVRDTIIKLLGQRTIEELAAIEQRNAIKDALRMAVNGVTPEGEIRRLYFTQYVLQ
jgi:flagellar FliL protein